MTTTHAFAEKSPIHRLVLGESGFVFDPMSGKSFTVNSTGLILLRHFQKESNVRDVKADLLKMFDADPITLDRDIMEFSSLLREKMK